MKKLLGVLSIGLACTMMAGCTPKVKPNPEPPVDKDAVLKIDDYAKMCVVGNNSVVVNGEDVDNDWAILAHNEMHAISLNQLAAIDAALEAKVEEKGVKGLYVFENLVLGARDAGWASAKRLDSEGNLVTGINGSYVFKCVAGEEVYDEESDTTSWLRVNADHFPSAEHHTESLTPDTFWAPPTLAHSKTEVGEFDHNSDPSALEAGVYTVVLAMYKDAKVVGTETDGENTYDVTVANGIALIKTGEREAYVPPVTYPVTKAEVIGGWVSDWSDPREMALQGTTFTYRLELEAAAELKVRFNGEWKVSLGATALESKVITDPDDNIRLEAGTYNITVKLSTLDDIKVGDTLEEFTIEPEGEIIHTAVPVESMTVAGTFNSWGDLAMTKDGNTFSAVVEFAEEEKAEYQFKVKVNAGWTYCFGAKYFNNAENEGNAWVAGPGKYDVSITLSEAAMEDISLDQTVTAASVTAHEEAAVELVLDIASAGLGDTALTEAKEVTLGDLVLVLEGGWMQSSQYNEIGTDTTAGTIKAKDGNTVVIEKVIIDCYKYNNYKVTVGDEEVTGVASSREGKGGANSKVFEYTLNSASFTLQDTYTKGNSWVYQIIFVVAAAQ